MGFFGITQTLILIKYHIFQVFYRIYHGNLRLNFRMKSSQYESPQLIHIPHFCIAWLGFYALHCLFLMVIVIALPFGLYFATSAHTEEACQKYAYHSNQWYQCSTQVILSLIEGQLIPYFGLFGLLLILTPVNLAFMSGMKAHLAERKRQSGRPQIIPLHFIPL